MNGNAVFSVQVTEFVIRDNRIHRPESDLGHLIAEGGRVQDHICNYIYIIYSLASRKYEFYNQAW